MASGQRVNEFNLVPRPQAERDTLEKMRRKLASATPSPAVAPAVPRGKAKRKSKYGTWVFLLVAVQLIGVNFVYRAKRDVLLEAIGLQDLTRPLSPPKGLERDELARFWAYAAYDQETFRSHFKIAENALIDVVDAQHHLADLMDRGLGTEASKEVAGLRRASESGKIE